MKQSGNGLLAMETVGAINMSVLDNKVAVLSAQLSSSQTLQTLDNVTTINQS